MKGNRWQKDRQERDGTGEKAEDRRQEGKTGYRCMKTYAEDIKKERKKGGKNEKRKVIRKIEKKKKRKERKKERKSERKDGRSEKERKR
jgi:hypothetical protein